MKSILIISPSFPPVNAADMHRVRQSVSYFKELDWDPTVVTVNPAFCEAKMDALLEQTLPQDLKLIRVNAFSSSWTRKIGLGSLALRSLWFYFKEVNALLKRNKYDLIYFSTTMFPVLILGSYWKKRFNVPYVIDMQDPWHSNYYQSKPKHERPPKYWFSYRLNKYLEPLAMKEVDGIIAVSEAYNQMLQAQYPSIRPDNCTVIPFGAFGKDMEVLQRELINNPFFNSENKDFIYVVYVGRAGYDMDFSLSQLFEGFKKGLADNPQLFGKVRMYFIGTSYAPDHLSKNTILPIAERHEVAEYVVEYSARVPYFTGLQVLKEADILLMPGSDDPKYTASKLYPYILAKKPILAIFHSKSSVINILQKTNAGVSVSFNGLKDISNQVYEAWFGLLQQVPFTPLTDWQEFEPYTAREMSRKQVNFFNMILKQ